MKKLIAVIMVMFSILLYSGDIKKAVPFKLENIKGDMIELDSLTAGGPVLINFWASWCKPCKEEMPELYKISKEYKDKGLKVVTVTIDKPSQAPKANNFLVTKGIELELLKDCTKKVFKSFGGGNSVPLTVIIDTDKNIVFKKKGQINPANIRKQVEKLLAGGKKEE